MKQQFSTKTKTLLFLVFLTAVVYFGVKFILPLFFPFIFAYWLAKYSYPISYLLNQKLRLPMALAGLFTLSIILCIIGICVFCITNTLLEQVNELIHNIPVYQERLNNSLVDSCHCCDKFLKNKTGTTLNYVNAYISDFSDNVSSDIIPCLTKQTLNIMKRTLSIITATFIMIFSALLIIIDHQSLKELYQKSMFYEDIDRILAQLSKTGLKYIKIQLLIICVIAVICSTGLFFNGNTYPLLIGIIIAILDALPLFGSGTILIPWAIIQLFTHNIKGAIILLATYVICQITRQFLESKLLGDTLGLAPIYFVMSLFIGISLFGLTGVVLGPFSVLLIKTLYHLYKPSES